MHNSATFLLAFFAIVAHADDHWQQCGGEHWQGSTSCSSDYICARKDQWYSQCLTTDEAQKIGWPQAPAPQDASGPAPTSQGPAPPSQGPAPPSPGTTQNNPTPPPQASGDAQQGITTRYWDCCKVSCAWSDNPNVYQPANQCDLSGKNIVSDHNAASSGSGGSVCACSAQTPWQVSDTLAYGFAARKNGDKSAFCGFCYELTFTSTSLKDSGKKMIVQINNSGDDLQENQFDIAMPGSGQGIFTACCQKQFPNVNMGANQGGADNANDACAPFVNDADLYAGCQFRFSWFEKADNPSVSYRSIDCPPEIIAKSNLRRV